MHRSFCLAPGSAWGRNPGPWSRFAGLCLVVVGWLGATGPRESAAPARGPRRSPTGGTALLRSPSLARRHPQLRQLPRSGEGLGEPRPHGHGRPGPGRRPEFGNGAGCRPHGAPVLGWPGGFPRGPGLGPHFESTGNGGDRPRCPGQAGGHPGLPHPISHCVPGRCHAGPRGQGPGSLRAHGGVGPLALRPLPAGRAGGHVRSRPARSGTLRGKGALLPVPQRTRAVQPGLRQPGRGPDGSEAGPGPRGGHGGPRGPGPVQDAGSAQRGPDLALFPRWLGSHSGGGDRPVRPGRSTQSEPGPEAPPPGADAGGEARAPGIPGGPDSASASPSSARCLSAERTRRTRASPKSPPPSPSPLPWWRSPPPCPRSPWSP